MYINEQYQNLSLLEKKNTNILEETGKSVLKKNRY